MIASQRIAEITNAQLLQYTTDTSIHFLLLDSRKIFSASQSIFFAIKGLHHDGHNYLKGLYDKGVRHFIITNRDDNVLAEMPQANIWLVQNSVHALQQIAGFHRNLFSIPVIGITGSNGKTIVKEWLAQLLQKEYAIVKNPKSYNSQIGVPLSVWEMNERHTLGIFEAGISQPHEMENLAQVIKPTIGLITNLGPAHDEGFESTFQKITEKAKLFDSAQVIFYHKKYSAIEKQLKATGKKLFSWSTTEPADMHVTLVGKNNFSTHISVTYAQKSFTSTVPFVDEASLENIFHCIAVMLYLGIDTDEIKLRLQALHPVAMRLELKEGINSCYLIDDTYNNDLSGLAMAVNFLDQQKHRTKKTIILSDLLQTGIDKAHLYQQIADMLREKNISTLIGIGPELLHHRTLFSSIPSSFYASTEEYLSKFDKQHFSNELILLKGARSFEFEKIVKLLQHKVHGTVLEVNLDALVHNLNFYRSRLKEGTKIMVMVKAFAYGSGHFEVANLLQFHRVDYLAVAYADEGVALRENGITLPIMVMNPSYQSFDTLVKYNLEPELYSFKITEAFLQYLNGTKANIHLKLDTGMRRLGFEKSDIASLSTLLDLHKNIRMASVFTHLAAADEAIHNPFTEKQLSLFDELATILENTLGYKPLRHALNSAGIVRFPNSQMDMVRLGIGLYGVEANGEMQQELRTVGTLKTIISQIKKVPKGETVGYSRKGVAVKDTIVATIAIGYADGYDRSFSNGVGKVLVNGTLCPIIGNVCMDMCMVDITGVRAEEGDEVIVFGETPNIIDLAKSIQTIPYELLTGISERVKRVFYAE